MSTDDISKDALIAVLGNKAIAYHPEFAHMFTVKAAVFLSQLLYWHGKGRKDGGWIYKTGKEWEIETGLTRYEQEHSRAILKNAGVLEEKLAGIPAIVHFRLDLGKLAELVSAWQAGGGQCENAPDAPVCRELANSDARTAQSITESTHRVLASSETSSDDGGNGRTKGQLLFLQKFQRKRFATPDQADAIRGLEVEVGYATLQRALTWAAENNIRNISSIRTAAHKMAEGDPKVKKRLAPEQFRRRLYCPVCLQPLKEYDGDPVTGCICGPEAKRRWKESAGLDYPSVDAEGLIEVKAAGGAYGWLGIKQGTRHEQA